MQTTPRLTTAAAIAALLAAGGLAPAMAQDAPATEPQTEAPAEMQAGGDFSEEKLDAFATAAIDVSEIQRTAAEKLGAASGEEEQGQIIETANTDVVAAIEAAPGITVEEYIQIADAAQADAELAQRLQDKIEAVVQEE